MIRYERAGIMSVASINVDGDAERGRVFLVLYQDGIANVQWYGTDDGHTWASVGVGGKTVAEAEEALAVAYSAPQWGLEWPWDYA